MNDLDYYDDSIFVLDELFSIDDDVERDYIYNCFRQILNKGVYYDN